MKFGINDDLKKYVGPDKETQGAVDYTMGKFIDDVLASTDERPSHYFRN